MTDAPGAGTGDVGDDPAASQPTDAAAGRTGDPAGDPAGEPAGDPAGQHAGEEPGAGPSGDHPAYDLFHRGLGLLDGGSPAAASQVLARAAELEPDSRSLREALARAQFAAGSYAQARSSFEAIVASNPSEDYAHFGLGMAAQRTGDLRVAVEHLALAVAMRPDLQDYRRALAGARAALSAQDPRQGEPAPSRPSGTEVGDAGAPQGRAPLDAGPGYDGEAERGPGEP